MNDYFDEENCQPNFGQTSVLYAHDDEDFEGVDPNELASSEVIIYRDPE